MRIIEALILAAVLTTLASFFFRRERRPRWLVYLPGTALALVLIHLGIERYRWQMVPAYAMVVILFVWSLRDMRRATPPVPSQTSRWRKALRIASVLLGLVVFAIVAALPLVFPVFDSPRPTGPHLVGTTRMSFLDRSRPEVFTADPNDHRDLAVQIWYPASPAADARREPFWEDEVRPILAVALGLPRFLFDHMALVPSHSHPKAALSGARTAWPVLIFSHGYAQGFPAQNKVLMEELASHGYAVFSIGHPYEGSAIIYPDGRVVGMNKDQIAKVGAELQRAMPPGLEKFKASRGKAERAAALRELIGGAPTLTESVRIWTADTRFVLDRLEEVNAGAIASPFARRLDFSRLGVLGMSFGGTTAGEVCLEDNRVKAGVNLDGLQFGRLIDQPLKKPFMFMNSQDGRGLNEPVYERAEGPAYYVTVKGSKHLDYSDLAFISPLFKHMGATGTVGGQRMTKIYSAYVLAFFDKYVKGQESPLLAGPPSIYPEVEFQSRAPQRSP